jgi:hypothetical protein
MNKEEYEEYTKKCVKFYEDTEKGKKFQRWADCWGMVIFIIGGLFWLILFFIVRG